MIHDNSEGWHTKEAFQEISLLGKTVTKAVFENYLK
jgi:hypothetical protein